MFLVKKMFRVKQKKKKEIFSIFKFRNIITPTWTSGLGNYQTAKAQSWRPVPERFKNIKKIVKIVIFRNIVSIYSR